MGICTWDMFEESMENSSISLSPEFIYKTVKENENKEVFGWVLNYCHKYS